jgi:FlaA1/EpsC-like NDP-sugar epimerase
VLTAFRAQIEQGGPLTVTHPDVTRYFMTIEEAVQLVIQAGAIGGDGHAMVLDMGEPVRIYDVARQLAASRDPEVPIEFTGLRPGEKLHEDLFCSDEAPSRSAHELIRFVDVPTLDPDRVRDLDPTGNHAEVLEILVGLADDIDHRSASAAVFTAALEELDLVAAEFDDTPTIN